MICQCTSVRLSEAVLSGSLLTKRRDDEALSIRRYVELGLRLQRQLQTDPISALAELHSGLGKDGGGGRILIHCRRELLGDVDAEVDGEEPVKVLAKPRDLGRARRVRCTHLKAYHLN